MFTLTGTLKDHAGKPVADSAVVIIPSPSMTKDASGNTVYLGGTTVYTDANGDFTASLVADEDNIVYTVRSHYGGPLDQPIHFNSPTDGATIDLADVTPVMAPKDTIPYATGLPSSASDGQILAYDESTGKWVAQAGTTVNGVTPGEDGDIVLTPDAIDAVRSTILDVPSNLFVRADAFTGLAYTAGAATPSTSSIYSISDYFPVVAGQDYVLNDTNRITWFDKSKTYLSDGIANTAAVVKTAPPGAWYARVTVLTEKITTAQVNRGTSLAAYSVGHPVRIAAANAAPMPLVSPDRTTFFDGSTNLFELATVTSGVTLISGVESANSGFMASDWISVEAVEAYTYAGADHSILRVAYYDADYTFLGDYSFPASFPVTQTTPPKTRWARLVVSTVGTRALTAQMNVGTIALEYEPGGWKIKPERLPEAEASGTPVVTPGATTFFSTTSNLFDTRAVTEGYVISPGQGEPSANSQYVLSAPIAVTAGADYSYGAVYRVVYYDEKGNYVANDDLLRGEGFGYGTLTAQGTYVRLQVHALDLEIAQMNAGDTLLSYERGATRVSPAYLPPTDPQPILDEDISGLWQASTPVADASFISTSVPQDVYTAYDALVASYPTYVSRTQYGLSFQDYMPIYAYRFRQTGPSNTSVIGSPTPKAKIIIATGTHGNERASIWTTYNLVDRLCQAWSDDPTLAALRYNVDLIVIPVVNPTGYRDNTRVSANGVDLCRNFPAGWIPDSVPGSSTYGGTEPLSEPETQALVAVLEAHPDALAVIDYHNFHTPDNNYDFLYGTPCNARTGEIIDATIRRMDRAWKSDEPTIVNQDPDTYIGFISTPPGGCLGMEAVARGHSVGLIWEQCWKVPTEPGAPTYSSLTMTWGLEAFVNFLTITLRA